MERVSKDKYYLEIAHAVAKRSTCLRKQYGAVIVNNDEIISTGYNGVPRKMVHCIDTGHCPKGDGKNYDLCPAVHAEQNAIISAARRDMIGGTLYLACAQRENPIPCNICMRMIINSGIKRIITEKETIEV